MIEMHYSEETQEEYAERKFGGADGANRQGATLALLRDILERLVGILDDIETYIEDGKKHEALDEARRIIAEARQEIEGR